MNLVEFMYSFATEKVYVIYSTHGNGKFGTKVMHVCNKNALYGRKDKFFDLRRTRKERVSNVFAIRFAYSVAETVGITRKEAHKET